MKSSFFKIGLLSAMVSVLVACGGGGGGGSNASSTPTPPSSLSGIAAIGAAMAGAKVTLKDSNGKTATASADNNGNFSFSNIGGFTAPLMLQAKGDVNGQAYTLHSLLISAPTTGDTTLNVTPATEALTAQTLGGTPTLAFASSGSGFKEAKSAKLAAAKAKLMAALRDTLLAMELNAEAVDLMTGKFAADQTGMDKLLDLVEFSANNQGVITLKDKKNSNTSSTITEADSSETVSKINVTVDGVTHLDTTGIKTLIDELINAGKENKNPAWEYFDDGYLFQGTTKEQLMSQAPSNNDTGNKDLTFDSNYKIKKYDQAAKVCYVGLQIKTNSSEIALMNIDMGVKYSEGSWKLYGDRAPFVYRSTPMFIYGESASGTGILKNGYLKNAVAITFPGTACNGCTDKVYESATIKISYDKGQSYSDSLTIGAGELSLFENNSSYRDDLLPTFNNETAKKLNDANQTGKLKIRITAYSKTLGQKTWEPPTFPLLFSSETEVKEFMKEKNWGIGQGLTTRSVTFTGDGILSVFAALKHPSYQDVLTIPYLASKFTEKQITPLNNEDSCSMVKYSFSQNQMTCDVFFDNSIIMTAGLISSDAKGRGIFYLKVP